MTVTTDAPPTSIRTTAYRVTEGDRSATVVWIPGRNDPGTGCCWSVALEHRRGFAVQDSARLTRDDGETGPFLNALGELPCPTPDDVEPQLQLAFEYASALLALERAHDARLQEAYDRTRHELNSARTRAGCIDR